MTYEYFDLDGVLLRTPVAADAMQRGFDGFEQCTPSGWVRYMGDHADVMADGYSLTPEQAQAWAEATGGAWVTKGQSIASVLKYNPNHDPKNGKFSTGAGSKMKVNGLTSGFDLAKATAAAHAVTQASSSGLPPMKGPFDFSPQTMQEAEAAAAHAASVMDGFTKMMTVNQIIAGDETTVTVEDKIAAVKWQLATNGEHDTKLSEGQLQSLRDKLPEFEAQLKAKQAGDLTKLDAPDSGDVLTQHTEKYWDKLSAEQQNAFLDYTSAGYRHINKYGIDAVDKQQADPDYVVPEHAEAAVEKVKLMDSAFKTASLPDAVTVYRAMDLKRRIGNNDFNDYVGREFVDKGFASSSLSRRGAVAFMDGEQRVLLKINLPKGAKAVPLATEGRTSTVGEYEVLIDRSSRFRITGITKSTDDGIVLVSADYLGTHEP